MKMLRLLPHHQASKSLGLSVKTDNDKRLADEPELQLTAYLNLYF